MLGRHADRFMNKQRNERIVAARPNHRAAVPTYADRGERGTGVTTTVPGQYEMPGPQNQVRSAELAGVYGSGGQMVPGMAGTEMMPGMGSTEMMPGMGSAEMMPGMGQLGMSLADHRDAADHVQSTEGLVTASLLGLVVGWVVGGLLVGGGAGRAAS